MAIPTDITIRNLRGSWEINNQLSDDPQVILKLQAVNFLTRKVIGATTLTLTFTSRTETDPSTSLPLVVLTVDQTITGGLKGTTEHRNLNWVEKPNSDRVFGDTIGRSRFINGTKGDDGHVHPEIELQTALNGKGEVSSFLSAGAAVVRDEKVEDIYIQDYFRNETEGWTAEQIWSLEVIDDQEYLTRRALVVKDGVVQTGLFVYNYKG